MAIHVDVKWKNEVFKGIELIVTEPLLLLKSQLFSLTGVPPERQKLMFKGLLKDDVDLSQLGLVNGSKILMIGSNQVLGEDPKVKFIEDLPAEEKDVLLGIRAFQPESAGLVNVGNTCYFNSVIQFLLPITELWDRLEFFKNIPGIKQNDFINSLIMLNKTIRNDIKPANPIQQMSLLRQLYPTFNKIDHTTGQYMQQDAEECLNFILGAMNEFCSGSIADEILGYTLLVKSERVDGVEEFIPPQNDNTRYMLLRCTMGTPTNPVNTVKEGIKQALTETVTITKEGVDVDYKKTSYLTSLPEYLIIHLVRFEWKQASSTSMTKACKAKICKRISFDKKLDISYICDKDLEESLNDINKYVYDVDNGFTPSVKIPVGKHKNGSYLLEAVITHQGRTADSGHYVSWKRVEEDNNDNKVDANNPKDNTNDEKVDNIGDKNDVICKDNDNNDNKNGVKDDVNNNKESISIPKNNTMPNEFWHKFDDDDISRHEYQSIDLCGGRSDYHIAVLLLYKAKYITIECNNDTN